MKIPVADRRRKQLAAIHAAKRDLAMDDDIYRQMLRNVTGVDSARDLDGRGLRIVLDHLRRIGWEQRPSRQVAQHPGTPHNLRNEAMLQKIGAQLADMGLPWSYADAIAMRQAGIERVAWVRDDRQLRAIVSALHVEAEKQALLAKVDTLLATAGISAAQAVGDYGLPKNWRRHRPTLRALIEQMTSA